MAAPPTTRAKAENTAIFRAARLTHVDATQRTNWQAENPALAPGDLWDRDDPIDLTMDFDLVFLEELEDEDLPMIHGRPLRGVRIA